MFCSHLSQCMIQANEQANSIVAAAAPDGATRSNSSETKERRLRYLLLAAPTAAAPTMGDGTNWRRLRRGTGANSIKSALTTTFRGVSNAAISSLHAAQARGGAST